MDAPPTVESTPAAAPPTPDELNRLWQHGLHEERLFHDRLNYFSVLETGLLSICGIMYNKEPAVGFFLPLTAVALVFTLLWLMIQTRHWSYCEHVNKRIAELVPEYKVTVAGFGRGNGLSMSKPLAMAVPALFAGTWVAFLGWLLVRGDPGVRREAVLTPDRVAVVLLTAVVVYLGVRLRRLERRVSNEMPDRARKYAPQRDE